MKLPSPPTRVLLTDFFREEQFPLLQAARPKIEFRVVGPKELTEKDIAWAEALVGFRPPKHLEVRGPKWIHGSGAGVDAWLFRREFPADVLLTRTNQPFGTMIGEYCLSRALAERQKMVTLLDQQRRSEWEYQTIPLVSGTRAVVVGTGEVGRGIAERFNALGARVDGVSLGGRAVHPFGNVFARRHLNEAIRGADWLILAAPLTEATYRMIGADEFRAAHGSYLINVGRGALVDEAAIVPALDAGHLRGAALDVFEVEPLPTESPLWKHPKVTISPHISGITSVEGATAGFLHALEALERGVRPDTAVDLARGY
jgi:phosphoglycerate dehydrogenase-like enzyme